MSAVEAGYSDGVGIVNLRTSGLVVAGLTGGAFFLEYSSNDWCGAWQDSLLATLLFSTIVVMCWLHRRIFCCRK